jgi:hypothetical protein
MIDLDVLIKKLVLEREKRATNRCEVCIVDGDGQKIVHSTELPDVEFRKTPEGGFIQIIFHGEDDDAS